MKKNGNKKKETEERKAINQLLKEISALRKKHDHLNHKMLELAGRNYSSAEMIYYFHNLDYPSVFVGARIPFCGGLTATLHSTTGVTRFKTQALVTGGRTHQMHLFPGHTSLNGNYSGKVGPYAYYTPYQNIGASGTNFLIGPCATATSACCGAWLANVPLDGCTSVTQSPLVWPASDSVTPIPWEMNLPYTVPDLHANMRWHLVGAEITVNIENPKLTAGGTLVIFQCTQRLPDGLMDSAGTLQQKLRPYGNWREYPISENAHHKVVYKPLPEDLDYYSVKNGQAFTRLDAIGGLFIFINAAGKLENNSFADVAYTINAHCNWELGGSALANITTESVASPEDSMHVKHVTEVRNETENPGFMASAFETAKSLLGNVRPEHVIKAGKAAADAVRVAHNMRQAMARQPIPGANHLLVPIRGSFQ